jgi:hypothetical protein
VAPPIAKINEASDRRPIERASVTVGSDGTFQRDLPLREDDVFLILLEKKGPAATLRER